MKWSPHKNQGVASVGDLSVGNHGGAAGGGHGQDKPRMVGYAYGHMQLNRAQVLVPDGSAGLFSSGDSGAGGSDGGAGAGGSVVSFMSGLSGGSGGKSLKTGRGSEATTPTRKGGSGEHTPKSPGSPEAGW
jgi:hypothetical protein